MDDRCFDGGLKVVLCKDDMSGVVTFGIDLFLFLFLIKQMADGSAADGFATEQLHCDPFDGSPVTRLIEQMFHLSQEPTFESLGLPLASSLHSQTTDVAQVCGRSFPSVRSGVSSFGCRTGERNQYLSFQPIFRRSNSSLLKLTPSEPSTSR